MTFLEDEESLARFLESFENGTFPGSQFKHPEHLAIAACYLYERSLSDATERARAGIRAFNELQGGQNTVDAGYHETLTVFWLVLIDSVLDRNLPRIAAARQIVERFASQRDIHRQYYSYNVVNSRAARGAWVKPDLQRLPGDH